MKICTAADRDAVQSEMAKCMSWRIFTFGLFSGFFNAKKYFFFVFDYVEQLNDAVQC